MRSLASRTAAAVAVALAFATPGRTDTQPALPPYVEIELH